MPTPDTEILTPSQKSAFNALACGNGNIFLTGSAGTGKSFVLRKFIQHAKAAGITTACVAPTGIAAIPLGGVTTHRFFRVRMAINGEQALRNLLRASARIRRNLGEIDVLIIDEISMLHGWLFDAFEEGTRRVFGSSLPWAGKRIVVVGDFLQLPPVASRLERADAWQWAFESSAWKRSQFRATVLSEVVRQADTGFINALNEARIGAPGAGLARLMRDRCLENVPRNITHLYPRNDSADEHNARELEALNTFPCRTFKTSYQFNQDPDVEKVSEGDFPIPREITLRPGAEVIFRQNHPNLEWVNGTRGSVKGFARAGNEELVIVDLSNGTEARVPAAHFAIKDHKDVTLATAENYPLQLGWGITIHKSQGMTLDRAFLGLSEAFAPGQAYVALSRVRSEQGVFLDRANPFTFTADRKALKFMMSLRDGVVCEFCQEEGDLGPRGFRRGQAYSKQDIETVLGTRIPIERFNALVVTDASGSVQLVKGQASWNPLIADGELWVAYDPNPHVMRPRLEQIESIRHATGRIPLFIRAPGNQGRVWMFDGHFRVGSIFERREDFSRLAAAAGWRVHAVIRLQREVE